MVWCAEGSYFEGFHFEVDQLDSIKVHLVVDVVHNTDVGRNLRKTCIYVRKRFIKALCFRFTWTQHTCNLTKHKQIQIYYTP